MKQMYKNILLLSITVTSHMHFLYWVCFFFENDVPNKFIFLMLIAGSLESGDKKYSSELVD